MLVLACLVSAVPFGGALGCGGGSGEPALPVSQVGTGHDWLDGGDEIEAKHVSRVLSMGDADPQVKALFAEARAKLGGGTDQGLAARFEICGEEVQNEPGRTTLLCEHALLGMELDDVAAGKPTPSTKKRLDELLATPSRDARVQQHAEYVLVERTLLPKVCVMPRLSLAEAYEVVVHELVHALSYQPCQLMESARSEEPAEAFRAKVLLSPGGEVDAYTASIPARLRLGQGGNALSAPLIAFFDPKTLALRVPRTELVTPILVPPPAGLGYGVNRMKDPRGELRTALVSQLSLRRDLLAELVQRRRAAAEVYGKNIPIHQHNIDAARHNLEVARQRNDARLGAEWRAKLAASEAGQANARKMIELCASSEKRLGAELTEIEAEIARLSGKSAAASGRAGQHLGDGSLQSVLGHRLGDQR
jgi:hypothetical protein